MAEPVRQKLDTAYHEAGHAAVSCYYYIVCGFERCKPVKASIIAEDDTLGRVTFTSLMAQHEDAEREELEALIIGTMAGKAAQLLLPRDDLTEDLDFEHYWFGGDKKSIIDGLLVLGMHTNEGELNEVEPYAEFLWRRTINITRRAGVRQSIDDIASALLEQEELDENELLALFRDSYGQHSPLPPSFRH